jgi:FMN phosphatase YigB (HAD superfamily)
MKTKLVVFDLFGTLAEIGKKTSPYRKLLIYVRKDLRNEFIKNVLLKNFSFREVIKAIDANFDAYHDFLKNLLIKIDSVYLFNETLPVLGEIKKRGLKTGVISNLASPYKIPFYNLKLNELIDFPIFSCDVGFIKPGHRIFQIMQNRAGLPNSDIIMIGDSLVSDVFGSESVGIKAYLLDRNKKSPYQKKICSLNELLDII